ncbi:MAG: hypothetical protein HY814_09145 [Candidatus Riflebacteria bacterium]|nr:hypothetical protein [Candidatus Riflebacteria bacterium]
MGGPRTDPVSGGLPSDAIGSEEADVSLPTWNVVLDAPWRVQLRPDRPAYLPVLFFFPEAKKYWLHTKILRLRIYACGSDASEQVLWEDTADGPPVAASMTDPPLDGTEACAVDAFGHVSKDLDIVRASVAAAAEAPTFRVSEIDDASRGWHIIVRVPIRTGAVSRRQTHVVIGARVDYRRLGENDDTVYTGRRKLYVELDSDGFPVFDGWHYYDSHVHTAAEFDPDLSVKAIRKSFGAPPQMVKEAAYAIGMLDGPQRAKGRVIITDHNCFFSDGEVIRAGPSSVGVMDDEVGVRHPEYSPYFVDVDGSACPRGQKEYENLLDEFGITMGEEVTLHKGGGFLGLISGTLGSHLLTYSTRHFMGPFHGGRFFVYKSEENPNPLEKVLEAMATDPHFPKGFAYAAHPFSRSALERALLSSFTDREVQLALRGEFVRRDGSQPRDFVFKGFQGWNGKDSRSFSTNIILPERTAALLEDPTWHDAWRAGSPDWDDTLQYGLCRWHQYLSDSLASSLAARPGQKFIRKFYFSGGTDAHGDFNRDSGLIARGLTALPAQILRFLKIFSMSDNAFGKVRTYVDATSLEGGRHLAPNEIALQAFARGQSVVTDGPVLDFVMDSNAQFDSSNERLSWHSEPRFENADGRIGGDGRLDGLRTMLVAGGTSHVLFRFRWTGAPAFGGPVTRLEVYQDEPGGSARLIRVQRNTGLASVLEPRGLLDPQAPADSSGWRLQKLADVRHDGRPAAMRITKPCAISLGGFTTRGTEAPYDFRCYTNPIWAVPVSLGKSVRSGSVSGSSIAAGGLVLTFRFPVSMQARAYDVRLLPLDERGNSFGNGVPLTPVSAPQHVNGWTANGRYSIDSANYAVTNRQQSIDLSATQQAAQFCVVFKQPADIHGNVLNSLAWVVELKN